MSISIGSVGHRRLVACWAVVFVFVLLAVWGTRVYAITYGEPDGNAHPNVGSMVLRVSDGGLFQWCTGTLISEDVFLTAGHCVIGVDEYLAANPGYEMLVTFDPTISSSGTFYTGVRHVHPDYRVNPPVSSGGFADAADVGVIVLDQAPGITPAQLPEEGLLDQMKADRTLRKTRFTAVGYGAVRQTNTTGYQGILDNLDRNRAEQGFSALTQDWLLLPMTFSNGNGGTCYGDSGGPHFIHIDGVETDIVAAITSTGDGPCKATDWDYRMDTASTRDFLANFVDLP